MSFTTKIDVGAITTILDVDRLVASLIIPSTFVIQGTMYIVSRYEISRYPRSIFLTEIMTRYRFGDKEEVRTFPTSLLISVYEFKTPETTLREVVTQFTPPPSEKRPTPAPVPITPPERVRGGTRVPT
jgi:hypothetical protein